MAHLYILRSLLVLQLWSVQKQGPYRNNQQENYLMKEIQIHERRNINYRSMLYSDNFNLRRHCFPPGSVGGCYIIPMRLSFGRKRFVSSASMVSSLPPGASSNHAFHCHITDIVHGAVERFERFDGMGKRSKTTLQNVWVFDIPPCFISSHLYYKAHG